MKFLFLPLLIFATTLLSGFGAFKTVIIDAGHGGRDNGGSYGKVYEKWLALDTATRIQKKLQDKGIQTCMTRVSDQFITLPGRVKIGNRFSNAIFVSVHYNFTWKRDVSGLETFYCTPQSKPLADLVHRGMLNEVRTVNRGVKYSRFYVIRHSKHPAILVEAGFVSNSKERGRTKEGWYREAIADGIVDGILAYRSAAQRW
jgi:N-acetylmuramoyl-L-alanine amidase